MRENCARPGCGHPRDPIQGSSPHFLGHRLDGCHDCPEDRPCPGYRTAEQQEAWVEAHLALGPARTEVPARILKRLLELYP